MADKKLIPVHPGEILADELKEIGMSANALAMALGVPADRIGKITKCQRGITPDTAIRLAEYFGGEPRFWTDLQAQHDLGKIEAEQGEMIRSQVRKAS